MTHTRKLTTKGQVTIPLAVRRQLNVMPGEQVNFEVTKNGHVKITKNNWETRLAEIQSQIQSHLTANNIKPIDDETLDKLLDEAKAADYQAKLLRSQK